ncbi:Oligopeptide transporter OPT superfamily [Cynara cardunculus var. scolymus]|uniref:Oligopeptide transporter OPT superfamily n=1 Tax=Cynara cardunculus var. scolymus TaxID=59895 RepID=A0A118K402_CYNCS|nr:Oligopeptide transporter OPT superfamily [Cynara cardunculus var. scolymus]
METESAQPIDSDEDSVLIEQVRLTVATTDDPTLPVWTFRMWFLGILSCAILSFLNTFFAYRTEPLIISMISVQVATLPLGRFMASALPTNKFVVLGQEFFLNPGPFNMKEHVLISIFANAGSAFGSGTAYAVGIVDIIRAFYHRKISFLAGWILVITTQVLGYGWAGVLRKYVVDPAHMWWPSSLVQVSLFRALHETDDSRMSKAKFFVIALVCSFSWYIFPGYIFATLSNLSLLCLFFTKSVIAQQIGSGMKGLGFLSFTLDWSVIASYIGNPLVTPFFAILNVYVGFVIVMYIVLPITYWGFDLYKAKTFPIFSSHLFDGHGQVYNVSAIVNEDFEIDMARYNEQGQIHMSMFFALTYGLSFAAIVSTITHVVLFTEGTYCFYDSTNDLKTCTNINIILEIMNQFRASTKGKIDIHTRLMRKYDDIPDWWFYVLVGASFLLSLVLCIFMKDQIQMPWWGLIFACGLASIFTLPISIITATTNQTPGLNTITEYLMGVIYPGRPIANVTFKTYGYISMAQAVSFLNDFKLGHYMKIPPRSMFLVQVNLNSCLLSIQLYIATKNPISDGILSTSSNKTVANSFSDYKIKDATNKCLIMVFNELTYIYYRWFIGTIIAGTINISVAWWLLSTVENICQDQLLAPDSPWTCPSDRVFYDASVIWGLIGPKRIFGSLGPYSALNWFFLGGFLGPLLVYLLHKLFPNQKWIKLINLPVILGSSGYMPPATSVNFNSWAFVGMVFNFFVLRYRKRWWQRYNYVLSAALDAGLAFMGILVYFSLSMSDIGISWWGTDGEHCGLADCPTAEGVVVDGCPIN